MRSVQRLAKRHLRRDVFAGLLGISTALVVGGSLAQTFPDRPIRIVTGYAAGGGADIVARMLAEQISPKLGQPVVVENRVGAGTNIASQFVARSTPDGYTLLFTSNNHNLNAMIYSNPGYDPIKDFIPVIQVSEGPSLLATHPGTPFKTLKDVIDAARLKPGSLSYGSSGVGTPVHMAMELFKLSANVDIVHIPYKGAGQSVVDAAGGHIPLVIGSIAAMKQHIEADRLRPLGVSTAKRSTSLPAIPTMAEAGYPGAVHQIWMGVVAPSTTHPEVVSRLHRELSAALQLPGVRDRLEKLGLPSPEVTSVASFEQVLKADFESSQKIVGHLKLKAD